MSNTYPKLELGVRYPAEKNHRYLGACGIYALWCRDAVYIGESNFVPSRWDTHTSALRCGTHPYREIQDAYDNGDSIEFSLLSLASKTGKSRRMQEIGWIRQFANAGQYRVLNKDWGRFDGTAESILGPLLDTLNNDLRTFRELEKDSGINRSYISTLTNGYGVQLDHKLHKLLDALGLELKVGPKDA